MEKTSRWESLVLEPTSAYQSPSPGAKLAQPAVEATARLIRPPTPGLTISLLRAREIRQAGMRESVRY